MAVSAPFMLAGLVAAVLAETWPVRLGGAAMVAGASLALAMNGKRARRLGWALAAVGAVAVMAGCL